MAEGCEALFGPADDAFHPGADPWHTEGSWWSFCVPGRKLGGWIYHLTRLNLGLASGGAWLWDERTRNCFEAPYFLNQVVQPLGDRPRDLNDFRWPDGVSLKTLEPTKRYRLQFTDAPRLSLDLEYEAAAEPWVSVSGSPAKPFRMEQLCRVRGEVVLHGERIAVDCHAFRDHSWGVRREQTQSASPATGPFEQRPVIYLFGHAGPALGFFVMGGGGYLVRDGRRLNLVAAAQRIERDASDGHIARITVEAKDREGRSMTANGRTLSWILRPSNSGVALVHLVEWAIDGQRGWGELQDVWPYDTWAAYRRGVNGAK